MGSLGGVYWPHHYLYCVKRTGIHTRPTMHLYASSQSLSGDTGATAHYGEMVAYAMSNSDWMIARSIDVMAINSEDRYNFMDPAVDINLFDGVVDSNNIEFYSRAETGGFDTILCISPKFKLNLMDPSTSASISNAEKGISLIKTFYYADEGLTDSHSSRHLKKYTKAVYNTDDPLFERNDTEGPLVTALPSLGGVSIAYSLDTPEMEILRKQFGTVVNSDAGYASAKYYQVIRDMCKDIYLSTTTTRRIFLRDSQPNTLTNDDLQYLQKYTEFNLNTVSMLTTRSYTTMPTTGGGSY